MSENKKSLRTLSGIVVSAGAEKTISVKIERVFPHPVYGKYIKRTSKLLAHDEGNQACVGDTVVVSACKPISKRKVWTLEEITSKRK